MAEILRPPHAIEGMGLEAMASRTPAGPSQLKIWVAPDNARARVTTRSRARSRWRRRRKVQSGGSSGVQMAGSE